MDTAILALLGTIFAGVGLEVIKNWFTRGQKKIDAATEMRQELRKEAEDLKADAAALREEIRKVEKELDAWKEKYFLLLQEYLEIKSQLGIRDEDER